MIEERQRLEAALAEFQNFIGSVVHREYVAATQADLVAIETRILEDDITSISDLFTLLDLRAQRRVQKASVNSFEDTVATLEYRIKQMKLEAEQSNATKPIESEENEIENDVDV